MSDEELTKQLEESNENDPKYKQMVGQPIPRLILRLSVPTVIAMLVTAVYNIADTFFVSRLGTSASGAVGVVFSLMAIIQAVGFTLGMGAGSLVSRSLGKKDTETANIYFCSALFAAVVVGTAIAIVCRLCVDDLVRALGATDTIFVYARDYARIVVLGGPIMCASFVMNNVLRSEGRATLSAIAISLGGVLNIGLDALFVMKLNMGVAGAATATIIGQSVSCAALVVCYLSGKSVNKLSFKKISFRFKYYWEILKIGFPSLCRQGLASIATVTLNIHAAVYGDAAVAAMSIVGKSFMFILAIIIGIGQGFQPVSGYNFGAKRYDRVQKAFWFTVLCGSVCMTISAVALWFLAPNVMRIFIANDPEVVEIGAYAMRAQCIALVLQPFTVSTNMLHQSIGKAWSATFLACCRQGVFFLPLIYILPNYFGLQGVQLTQACSDVLALFATIPFLVITLKQLSKKRNAPSKTV